MIALRLVHLIERHSDDLAAGFLAKLLISERTSDLRKVPADELRERSHEIFHNLSAWLLEKGEDELERRYRELGARRASQGVRLSHFVAAWALLKEHLWEFLRSEAAVDTALELFGEIELLRALDRFFDRALYYAVSGYEQARAAQAGSPTRAGFARGGAEVA